MQRVIFQFGSIKVNKIKKITYNIQPMKIKLQDSKRESSQALKRPFQHAHWFCCSSRTWPGLTSSLWWLTIANITCAADFFSVWSNFLTLLVLLLHYVLACHRPTFSAFNSTHRVRHQGPCWGQVSSLHPLLSQVTRWWCPSEMQSVEWWAVMLVEVTNQQAIITQLSINCVNCCLALRPTSWTVWVRLTALINPMSSSSRQRFSTNNLWWTQCTWLSQHQTAEKQDSSLQQLQRQIYVPQNIVETKTEVKGDWILEFSSFIRWTQTGL